MIFLFTSTTILYIVTMFVMISATVFAVFTDIQWFVYLVLAIDIAGLFVLRFATKLTSKKYNKALDKMEYDIRGFFEEQYKFLEKPFVSANSKNLIKSNIAVGYLRNEQYDEALKIYAELEATGYQGFPPAIRFIAFINQCGAYLHIGDIERARMYLQNAETTLRTINAPQNAMYSLNNLLQITIAKFNFIANKNEQTAREYLNRLQESLSAANIKGGVRSSTLGMHYELGIVYLALGDIAHANAEFDIVLGSGAITPFVARVREYRETGDESVLEIQ